LLQRSRRHVEFNVKTFKKPKKPNKNNKKLGDQINLRNKKGVLHELPFYLGLANFTNF